MSSARPGYVRSWLSQARKELQARPHDPTDRKLGRTIDSVKTLERLSAQTTAPKRAWDLASDAFQKLLNWLDAGSDSQGQSYLLMRQRLVTYFDRKNCLAPDELADETLNRVARRLEEENTISSDTPAHYCYIVARYIFMEHLREKQRNEVRLERVLRQSTANDTSASELEDQRSSREKLMSCLDQCTEKLEPPGGDLIIRYYFGERGAKIENRRALARELGISTNALSIRACRIRDRLEACVENCLDRR